MLACGLVAVSVGCQSTGEKLSSVNPLPKVLGAEENAEYGKPERVVATWSEAVLHRNGEGTRGFGGRLFFYDRASTKPIRVEGQLVVYAFAEDGREATDHRPSKRYVFPPEQFARHHSESEIGPSYSVWLPWDAAGGPQSEVSLIARFEPLQGGGLVVSDQTRQRLPGAPRDETMIAEQQQNKSDVKQTSFYTNAPATEVKMEPVPEKKQTMTTTTISLPGKFMNRSPGTISPTSAKPLKTAPSTTTPSVTSPTMTPATRAITPVTTRAAAPATTVTPHNTAPLGTTTTVAPSAAASMGGYPAAANTANTTPANGASPTGAFQPTPVGTSVKYLTPGESVRQSLQPRSFGSLH